MATTSAALKTKANAGSTASSRSALSSSSLYNTLGHVLQVVKSRALLIILSAALTYLLSSMLTITILSSTVSQTTVNESIKIAISEAQNVERSLQVRFSMASSLDEIRRYALSKNMGMTVAIAHKQLPVEGLTIIKTTK